MIAWWGWLLIGLVVGQIIGFVTAALMAAAARADKVNDIDWSEQ